jgi:23S rRNA (cytidine1920-2'-O)/16S rRNA (cytidine1409-2'-O)-methyltransferase
MGLRADEALVAQGLVSSRARARALIEAGQVMAADRPVPKPSWTVPDGIALRLLSPDPDYASRGALKLAHALDQFGVSVDGRTVIDLGASTGGFCDLMLRRGAKQIFAVDVGRGQLLARLVCDPRVVDLSGTDARLLDSTLIPVPVELITVDLAFISITKAIGPALALAAPGCDLIALVKPQFEAGRQAIGKGGIVRDPADRARALADVRAFIDLQPRWQVIADSVSPILGGDGNQEFLIHARCT